MTMRHVPALLRRELAATFLSPTAYLVLLAFQVVAALDAWGLVTALARRQVAFTHLGGPMTLYLAASTPFWLGILVAVPVLTMRLIAEERSRGTLESLLTAPVTEGEVVAAKWLAGWITYLALLLPFVVYLPFLRRHGQYDFDPGPLLALFLGLAVLGMVFVAVGVLTSAASRSQLVAALACFAALFALVVAPLMGPSGSPALDRALRFVSPLDQARMLAWGQLDVRYGLLCLSATAVLLAAASRVLLLRRGD
jgi:ABC-2 type transport system permease protein